MSPNAANTLSNRFAAHLVNIDNRDTELGYRASGLKITLGQPFASSLQTAPYGSGAPYSDSTANWFLRMDAAREDDINVQGGIAASPYSPGLYLYGYNPSDKRLKENIKVYKGGLDIIKKLKVKSFNFKKHSQTQRGLIAQEVKKIIPEAVIKGLDYYELDWNKITPYLISAIQERIVTGK